MSVLCFSDKVFWNFVTLPASIQYHSFRLHCFNFKMWRNSELTSSQLQSQNYCYSWQKSAFKSFILLYYDPNTQNNTTLTFWCHFTKCKCIKFLPAAVRAEIRARFVFLRTLRYLPRFFSLLFLEETDFVTNMQMTCTRFFLCFCRRLRMPNRL